MDLCQIFNNFRAGLIILEPVIKNIIEGRLLIEETDIAHDPDGKEKQNSHGG
jgi:hypothetical protein